MAPEMKYFAQYDIGSGISRASSHESEIFYEGGRDKCRRGLVVDGIHGVHLEEVPEPSFESLPLNISSRYEEAALDVEGDVFDYSVNIKQVHDGWAEIRLLRDVDCLRDVGYLSNVEFFINRSLLAVDRLAPKSDEVKKAVERVDGLAESGLDWGQGDSVKPSGSAVRDAKSFIGCLYPLIDIFPHISLAEDGEINFYWSNEEIVIDLGFYGDGTYSYFSETKDFTLMEDGVLSVTPLPGKVLRFIKKNI